MQYTKNPPLDTLLDDPLLQFQQWLIDAKAAQMQEPTAMALGTVDEHQQPQVRMVLLKGYFEGGLCFYTHYDSRKSQALAGQPKAALTFWWDKLERSVRFEGTVEKLPRAVSEAYFHSRPFSSQVGAMTSRQSKVLEDRDELDQRYQDNLKKFEGQTVPLPDDWGGFVLKPHRIEFWQGRHGRLHDRFVYEGGRVLRLEP
jgi:pyridoxamine 5'-phosphate oxidase